MDERLGKILDLVCGEFGVGSTDLLTHKQPNRPESMARAAFAYILHHVCGVANKDVAKALNCKYQMGIYYALEGEKLNRIPALNKIIAGLSVEAKAIYGKDE